MTTVLSARHISRPGSADGHTTGFRPDVEGLRAIAVLLVLAYHAGVPAITGGFIGVDVFFVISGFLITGLLVREIDTTGRLSLARFYARRARRLLPATAVVLTATAVLTVVFLPPLRWAQVAWDIVTSSLYVVNWRLAGSVDYLAAENAPSPVQHFWSLAVEEQFYLVWPLLILVLARWHRRSGRSMRTTMLAGLAFIAVPSLLYSVYLSAVAPGVAYFVSTTRLWELALGAALAIAAPRLARLPGVVRRPAAWAGLVAIGVAALMFDAATAFPGYAALLPTLGAAAVIAAGVHPAGTGAGTMLGTAPMRWVGALSYSLYLWHWPLLVTATAAWGGLSVTRGVLVAAASVVPAWLTHRLVEHPIHVAPGLAARPARALGVGALATVVGLAAAIVPTALAPDYDVGDGDAPGAQVLGARPSSDPDGRAVYGDATITPDPLKARGDNADVYADGCHQSEQSAELASCAYGDVDSERVLALVGDSHAAQWQPTLDEVGRRHGWRVETYTKSACGFFSVDVAMTDGRPYTSCAEWNDALIRHLTGPDRPELVVTSGSNSYRVLVDGRIVEDDDERRRLHADGMADSWRAIVDAGVELVVLRNTPWIGIDVPECVSEHPDRLSECVWDRSQALERSGDTQLAAVDKVRGATLIDLNDRVCPATECVPVIGNVIVWRDPHHITATYARTLASALAAALAPVLR